MVQFSNYIAPILILPYISRVLGVSGFGVVMIALSICSIAFIITDYGFNLSAPYWIAKNRAKTNQVSQFVGAIFSIKLMLCFLVGIALFLYSCTKNDGVNNSSILCIVMLITMAQAFQPIWFFQGIEKMKNVTLYIVASKIIYLSLVFLFVKNRGDINIVLLSFLFSNLVGAIIAIRSIYKEGYKIKKPSKRMIEYAFRASTNFFFSRVAVSTYTSLSTFLVGKIAGVHQAAQYSAAEKLYLAGQSLTSPVSQALYPYLARSKDRSLLLKFIIYTAPIIMVGCVICIFLSPLIIKMFYGEGFSEASEILQVFLITIVITFISINLGYPAFASLGNVKIVNKTVYLGAIIQCLSLLILVITHNLSGLNVARSVFVTEAIVMLSRVLLFIKLSRNATHGKNFC